MAEIENINYHFSWIVRWQLTSLHCEILKQTWLNFRSYYYFLPHSVFS